MMDGQYRRLCEYQRLGGLGGPIPTPQPLTISRTYYIKEHLSPVAVRMALRELLVASSNEVSEAGDESVET